MKANKSALTLLKDEIEDNYLHHDFIDKLRDDQIALENKFIEGKEELGKMFEALKHE